MTTIATPDDDDALRKMDTDALYAELESGLRTTAEKLTRLAAVWRELERRGEDLSQLRAGILSYLPLIASGNVLAELVVRFAGTRKTLKRLACLPSDKQRELLAAGAVPLAVFQGGEYTHRMIPLASLTPSQMDVIFGDRCIRSAAEQAAYLSAPPPVWKPNRPVKRGKVVVDRVRATISIGRSTAPLTDVIAAMKAAGVNT